METLFSYYTRLPREAKYVIYSSVLPAIAYGMFFTDIAYFLTSVQGLPYELMGLIVTAMGVATFAASIPLGLMADKYGRKKMLIIGNLIASATIAVFALTTNPAILLAAAMFEGISEAAFSASSSALLADKAEGTHRNPAFSLFGFAQSMAFGFGSIAIPALVIFEFVGFSNKTSHALLYVAFAVLSTLSTLFLLKISEAKKPVELKKERGKILPKSTRAVLSRYVLTSGIISFGAGMVVPLMSAWFKLQYGIPDSVSGPILGLSSIAIAVATLAGPGLAARMGTVKAIVVTQAASTIFMIATPIFPSYILASAVYTTRAFLMNMATPLAQSMIMGLVGKYERGAASGISSALWRLPNALSTFIGAWLMALGFLAAPFFVAGLLYALSIVLFWWFFKETKMPEEISP
jgi:MFS family permease